MAKLTDKQELFAREYLKDLNATQAAIRAGYSEKTARSQANRLLTNVDIENRIAELKSVRNEEVGIDAAYVLRRLVEIDQMDVIDILRDDGTMLPISQWPKVWRITLQGMDISTSIQEFDEKTTETILKKIKWPDKVKNLELLGKHATVQAFKENIKAEVTGANGGPIVTAEMSPEEAAEKYKDLMG
ncbi:TPA: terminase small subunit [Salmonella enterica subsp. houtenae serovar 43:z4,z23:-]|nr:terminase small subunit [Salmonella enterica subsp. houtenae serovar 40:z4,z24:-]EDX6934853.1 terminase small subunit [Salmonella enterica subsp. houtenae serovar 40:z4,z24:-]EGH3481586.1 terminase small subunit [Salmonella enterica]EMC3044741.1 terminase small subunit [Salmonella enterica]HCA3674597.1 terminase small subunit [Salmonella enterica subsp. houtenae serovar Houten]